MSSLEADISFDEFTSSFSYAPVMQHCTPSPPMHNLDFSFDASMLKYQVPQEFHQYAAPRQYAPSHTRSSSRASIYSVGSAVDSPPESVCPGLTTPPRAGSPVRNHGPLLLPKIRSQDQDLDGFPPVTAGMMSTPPPAPVARRSKAFRHARSYTNPETLNAMVMPHFSFPTPPREDGFSNQLLCSPANFAQSHDPSKAHTRRCSSVEAITTDKYAYPSYRTVPVMQQTDFTFPSATYTPRAPSPLTMAASVNVTPEPTPTTTLMSFLTGANSAASLVRTVSFPHRDPNIKHFWWDIRNIRTWSSFNLASVLTLPGASLLNTPIPAPVLPQPTMSSRHPETEAALHSIYASYYLPKLNSALALCSERPLQLSVPAATKGPSAVNDLLFTANVSGEAAAAAAMFGGKPSARVVGLVRTFDRFNTGMRAEGNIKRVEYLRGLAAIHHAMREHGCRYGFILTEIELVLVRNGTESTPFFGELEVTSVQLAATGSGEDQQSQLTACLALWGLCQMAGDHPAPGHAAWKSEVGAPAEGTRRKAKARDGWIPAPQLAEKREAKRSRGWIWPEDAVGRKELGKRGVRYGGI
ncbi:unnamed protein product [Clonostachys rhizophaga]|uniref:Sialidase n=1 Tax=Clonostachys rhizophaga TaxID=160324 RepID=A0A9N9VGT9_9HYPO|nr:unnamed protein product [Clonostachys rhizophaga]